MDLSRWIAIAGVLAAAATTGYSTIESARLNTQLEVANASLKKWEKDFNDAKGIADSNAAAVETLRDDLAKQEKIAKAAQAAERKRAAELNTAKKRIRNAPTTDDGPVAPVLRNALDGLRLGGDGDAPADTAGANPSGAPTDQPVGPPLPAEAPAT